MFGANAGPAYGKKPVGSAAHGTAVPHDARRCRPTAPGAGSCVTSIRYATDWVWRQEKYTSSSPSPIGWARPSTDGFVGAAGGRGVDDELLPEHAVTPTIATAASAASPAAHARVTRRTLSRR